MTLIDSLESENTKLLKKLGKLMDYNEYLKVKLESKKRVTGLLARYAQRDGLYRKATWQVF